MANKPLVSPRDMLDIIFENRNRNYGAYQLRRDYPSSLGRAVVLGLLLIGTFLVLPLVLRAVARISPESGLTSVIIETSPPPVIETPTPPPPAAETPPPPARNTMRFVPPDPRPDDKVPEDTPPPAQENLVVHDGDVAAVDHEGDPNAGPSDLPTTSGAGIIETPVLTPPDVTLTISDVQKMPSFPGGEQELFKFLAKQIRYPDVAREAGIQGVVALTFVVDKNGEITEVGVLKDIGGGCGKEAMRVVNAMPRWSPGEANGFPVKVRFTLPVRFRLN